MPLLAWLCLALSTAAEEAKKEPPSLVEVATNKAGAMLLIREKLPNPDPSAQYGHNFGMFISADGLALLNLSSLATPNMPQLLTMDGKMLPLGTILGILPVPELALVKFKHKPKEWMHLARKEPEIGEFVAIAGLSDFVKLEEIVPPIIGPIMAKRSSIGGNLLKADYRRVMSLGAGMTGKQKNCLAQGSYVVNRQGELVAVKAGIVMDVGQTKILLSPLAGLVEQVDQMVKAAKPIPFPLPEAHNPIDLALSDPAYHRMDIALQQGDTEAARQHQQDLKKRYPESTVVRIWAFDPMTKDDGSPRTNLDDLPKLEATAPAALQVRRLQDRASFLALRKKDYQGALREYTSALALCPKDFPDVLGNMADCHRQLANWDECMALLRQVHALDPESISLAALLEKVLTDQGKLKEAQEFTDKIFELERLYQAK
jgi:tetratricopeptide (TPR) repeat protein